MKYRQTHPIEVVAAKAGISRATGFRMAQDPRLPSQKVTMRARRRLDPLKDILDAEVVPLLQEAPGLRPVAVFFASASGADGTLHPGMTGPTCPRTGCDIPTSA